MNKILSGLFAFLISTQLLAIENKSNLTVTRLLSDGFIKMTGEDIHQQLVGHSLIILDLQAGSEYEAKFLPGDKVKLKKIKEDKPETLTDPVYQGRASILTGIAIFTIKDNTVISTDGVRHYSSTLYQKGNTIFGARDIDNNKINFQIKIK